MELDDRYSKEGWATVRLYRELGDAQIMLALLREASIPVKLGVGNWFSFSDLRNPSPFHLNQVLVPEEHLEKARAILATRKDVGLEPWGAW